MEIKDNNFYTYMRLSTTDIEDEQKEISEKHKDVLYSYVDIMKIIIP